MKEETRGINKHTIMDLFLPCNGCIYWETPKKFGNDKHGKLKVRKDEAIRIKHGWFKKTYDMFGCCGKILYVDDKAAGYSQYALPQFLSNVAEYSKQPLLPSPDAILISCLYIQEEHQRKRLGTELLQTVLEDLRQKDYHAVETYSRDDSANNCFGPTEFLF